MADKAIDNFDFRLNGQLEHHQKPYYENKTSLIFGLIRNYMLHQGEKINSEDFRSPTNFDAGILTAKFPIELGGAQSLRALDMYLS